MKIDLIKKVREKLEYPIPIMLDTKGPEYRIKTFRDGKVSWGVTPMLTEKFTSMDVLFYKAMTCAKTAFDLKPGDNVVLTGGPINGQSGNTNTIKVEQV